MSKLFASGFASAVAMAAVAVSAPLSPSAETASATSMPVERVAAMSAVAGVPREALPARGECRIWYDALPATHQPAHMDCEHADWIAQRWGGRVIAITAEGETQLAAYEGRNDFTGVPVAALPRAGYCRVWVEGADAQAEQSDCRTARTLAAANGGRLLFMPL